MTIVAKTFRDTLMFIVMMLFLLLITAYYGCLLFEDTFRYDSTKPGVPAVKQDRYDTLGHGFLATFILLTTENYPSIEASTHTAIDLEGAY